MKLKTRTPFDVALDVFLKAIVPIEDTEVSPIRKAGGRVLARQMIAPRDDLTVGGQRWMVMRSLQTIR